MSQRVVVVGLGSIGFRHARLLSARPELEVSVCDPTEAALSRARSELGVRECFTDLDAALESRPAMMVIATPHNLHVPQAVRALDAGIHVLCEKPVSDTLDAARRLEETAARSDRVLAFGFHLHFHPGLRRLKQLVVDGSLGSVVHAHCRVGSYVTLVNSVSRYQSHTRGALLLDYAHLTDVLHWFFGRRPSVVSATAVSAGNLEHTADPNVLLVTCEYETMLATIHLNYVQMPERHEYEIVGDRGWAILDASTSRLRVGLRESGDVIEEHLPFDRDQLYIDEHQAFLDAVAGARQPESSLESAIVSMEIHDAIVRSLPGPGN